MEATNEKHDEDGKRKGKDKRRRKRISPSFLAKMVRSSLFIKYLQKKNHKEEVVVVSNLDPSSPSLSASSSSSSGFSSLSFSSSTTSTILGAQPLVAGGKSKKSVIRIKSCSSDKGRYDNYGHFVIDIGLLLLVSLVVMLVWGRVCAILWTSSCLFLTYQRRPELMLVATRVDDACCNDDGDVLLLFKSSEELNMTCGENEEVNSSKSVEVNLKNEN